MELRCLEIGLLSRHLGEKNSVDKEKGEEVIIISSSPEMEVIMENFFPEILIQYLLPFRQAFSKPGFGYFQGFIAALLLSQGRKCISHIANTCFFIDKSLSSWERFLASAQWDPKSLNI